MTASPRVSYPARRVAAERSSNLRARAPLAALLSFLLPGLGQLYNRQRRLGIGMALPVVVLIAAVAILVLTSRGAVIGLLFDQSVLIGLLGLNVLLLAWRLVSILQAHGHRDRLNLRRAGTWATLLLVLLAVGMHVLPGWYTVKAIDTLRAVAQGGQGGGGEGPRSAYRELGGTGGLPTPSRQPDIGQGQRVNVLLVGIDELPGREAILTDTMLIVSFDPDTGEAAMLSVPRDLYGAPLPDGGTYDDKLNSLMTVAANDPERYPLGGVGTLKATLSELLDVPIHYFASINLLGFKQAIDAVGGVDIQVERAIADPHYWNEYNVQTGFYIQPGLHHMDGSTALAYVRSRHGAGDDDFTRAARQQQLLSAVAEKLTAGNLVTALPGLLDAVKNTIATDVPSDRLPALARAVQEADLREIDRAVLQPPDYVTPATGAGGAYILVPDLAAIRELGRDLLGEGDREGDGDS